MALRRAGWYGSVEVIENTLMAIDHARLSGGDLRHMFVLLHGLAMFLERDNGFICTSLESSQRGPHVSCAG